MDLWPIASLPPESWAWSLEGAYATGGQPMVGPPQDADLSCGGWWTLELSLRLMGPGDVRQLRAGLVALLSSSPMVVVPCLDGLQPFPLPWGDASPPRVPPASLITFASSAILDNNVIQATLAAEAFMPAYPAPASPPTQAQIAISKGRVLKGGEYFTLIGTSGNPRLHQIGRVISVSSNVFVVSVLPAFRENYASGTQVAFDRPACTMKLDKSALKGAWPKLGAGFVGSSTVRFVETGQGPSA